MNFTSILKPVGGRCNLHCSYCYFKKRDGKKIRNSDLLMDESILESFINQACDVGGETIEFVWHGGEPLLAGMDFYAKALEHQYKYSEDKKIFNSIQTNGTLLDKRWIDFFAKNQFRVGVSIDGPAQFHDMIRKRNDGSGSFESVLKNIKLLQEIRLLSGAICCVSSSNCEHPKEIFEFFSEQGIRNIKFLQVQGRARNGKLFPSSVTSTQYADFLIQIFKEWIKEDNPEIEIREIRSIIDAMLGGKYRECMFAGECHKYFTIYPDGAVYGCDSLSKMKALKFGTVKEGLDKIEKSANYLKFQERAKEIKKGCSGCEWFEVCRGGCLQDWWPDIFHPETKNLFCPGLKKIFRNFQKELKSYDLI